MIFDISQNILNKLQEDNSSVLGFSTLYKYKTKTTNSQINKYKFYNKTHIK